MIASDLKSFGLRRAVCAERFKYGSVRGLGVKVPFAYSTLCPSVVIGVVFLVKSFFCTLWNAGINYGFGIILISG